MFSIFFQFNLRQSIISHIKHKTPLSCSAGQMGRPSIFYRVINDDKYRHNMATTVKIYWAVWAREAEKMMFGQ